VRSLTHSPSVIHSPAEIIAAGRITVTSALILVEAAGRRREAEAGTAQGLIRAGYVYRNGDEHHLTGMGQHALAQPGVYPGSHLASKLSRPSGTLGSDRRRHGQSFEGPSSACPRFQCQRFQLGLLNARADNAAMGNRTRGLDISINAKRQEAARRAQLHVLSGRLRPFAEPQNDAAATISVVGVVGRLRTGPIPALGAPTKAPLGPSPCWSMATALSQTVRTNQPPNVPISNEPFGQWYNLGANHHHWVVAPGEDVGSTAVALPGIWAATEGGDGCSWGEYVDASTAENLRVPRPF
jgi:hypothetical protein